MLPITSASSQFVMSVNSLTCLSPLPFPADFFVVNSRRRVKKRLFVSLNVAAVNNSRSFLGFTKTKIFPVGDCSGFVRKCKNLESEEDFALEAEILEFMKHSKNPEAFPSKKELVDAGRVDLVNDIENRGGWLVLGWDLDESETQKAQDNGVGGWGSIMDQDFGNIIESIASEGDGFQSHASVSSPLANSSQSASSSGRSLETVPKEESGIEGILSRLGKQRDMTFGFGLREKGDGTCFPRNGAEDNLAAETSIDSTATGLQGSTILTSIRPERGIQEDLKGNLSHNGSLSELNGLRNPLNQETWRTWSTRRAGFQDGDFEAAEISLAKFSNGKSPDNLGHEIRGRIKEDVEEWNSGRQGISHNQIRSRLQLLELELSSVLLSMRSNKDGFGSQTDQESSADDLRKLSDAWEFQENEIMNAQAKLRSLRAKLAVLEGKMALAMIDAQKTVEEKQRRIEEAHRTLRLLCAACIIWRGSASEVLLSGSFDGWATKRKMEKSGTGIFSLSLKLYPGRYEIKFIVDGEWRIDPLRPIVQNHGYENNLLIIT